MSESPQLSYLIIYYLHQYINIYRVEVQRVLVTQSLFPFSVYTNFGNNMCNSEYYKYLPSFLKGWREYNAEDTVHQPKFLWKSEADRLKIFTKKLRLVYRSEAILPEAF